MMHETIKQRHVITVHFAENDARHRRLDFNDVTTEIFDALGVFCHLYLEGHYDHDDFRANFSFRSMDGTHYNESAYHNAIWAAIRRVERRANKEKS